MIKLEELWLLYAREVIGNQIYYDSVSSDFNTYNTGIKTELHVLYSIMFIIIQNAKLILADLLYRFAIWICYGFSCIHLCT